MAAIGKVVTEVAGRSRWLDARVERVANQMVRDGLAPTGQKGGGKNTRHWDLEPLSAMPIIMATANPITAARSQVDLFGEMVLDDPTDRFAAPEGDLGDLALEFKRWTGAAAWSPFRAVPGRTPRAALKLLIDRISRPEGQALRRLAYACGLEVQFAAEGFYPPFTTIAFTDTNNRTFKTFYRMAQGQVIPYEHSDGALLTTHTLQFGLIETLADLWADTRAHTDARNLSSAPASAKTERKKAAGSANRDGLPETDQPKSRTAPMCNEQSNAFFSAGRPLIDGDRHANAYPRQPATPAVATA